MAKRPDNERGLVPVENSELPHIDIEELKHGSMVVIIEAAWAMHEGKLAPVGYDKVTEFFRTEKDRISAVHHVWLMAEAEQAGRLKDLAQDFPDAKRLTEFTMHTMQTHYPHEIEAIKARVQSPDYSPAGARRHQQNAEAIFNALFPQNRT